MLPYWYDQVVPDLRSGRRVVLVAHGNSMRALVKHLDGIGDEEIVGVNIPTGVPLVYRLDDELARIESFYLGDPDAVAAASEAVATPGRMNAPNCEFTTWSGILVLSSPLK